MRNVWLITKREYLQRARARSFEVITATGFVLILALAFAPAVLDRVQSATGGVTIAVVDPQRDLSPVLREALPNGAQTGVVAVGSREAAKRGIEAGGYDGALIPRTGTPGPLSSTAAPNPAPRRRAYARRSAPSRRRGGSGRRG